MFKAEGRWAGSDNGRLASTGKLQGWQGPGFVTTVVVSAAVSTKQPEQSKRRCAGGEWDSE